MGSVNSWKGNGRTATLQKIQTQSGNGKTKEIIKKLTQDLKDEDSKTTITRLLIAFFFCKGQDLRESEDTYEFTHKTFGEFLTARRLVKTLETISEKLTNSQTDYDDYDENQALTSWFNVYSASPIDFDLFNFITNELELCLRKNKDVSAWQKTLCNLVNCLMRQGMPMSNCNNSKTFLEQLRNAESALLIMLNSCARVTKNLSKVNWPSPTAFGDWISRLVGQRTGIKKHIVLDCLSYLNLNNCILLIRKFLLR